MKSTSQYKKAAKGSITTTPPIIQQQQLKASPNKRKVAETSVSMLQKQVEEQLEEEQKKEANKNYIYYGICNVKQRNGKDDVELEKSLATIDGEDNNNDEQQQAADQNDDDDDINMYMATSKQTSAGNAKKKAIIEGNIQTAADDQRQSLYLKKLINYQAKGRKYEFALLYHKPNGNLGVRKMFLGTIGDLDAQSSTAEHKDSSRDKWAKLLIDHEKFSREVFYKCGGIFNTKFWDVNLSWNAKRSQSLEAAAASIDDQLKTIVAEYTYLWCGI